METQLKHYGALIEKIRKDRKLSREDLCEGIMSKRNYQRFASGEVSISSDKILLVTDKLMLNTYSLQEIYKINEQDEYQKLKMAFNFVTEWNEIEANRILATIDYDLISSAVNKQIYGITDLLIKRKNNKITDQEYYRKTEILIDFQNIFKKSILNNVELSGLFALMLREFKTKESRILNYLLDLIQNDKIDTYWMTNEIRTGIYANITRSLYYREDYDKCYSLCEDGLVSSNKTNRFIGLSNLLAYKVLSLNKLGRFDDAIRSAVRLYMHILVEGNENKINFFKNLINENLKINIDDILIIKKEG